MTSLVVLGLGVGLLFGAGAGLVVAAALPERPTLAARVLPYVPEIAARLSSPAARPARWRPARSGDLPGRLARAGLATTVADHRVDRLRWGAVALAVAAVAWLAAGLDPTRDADLLMVSMTAAFAAGAASCELRLALAARTRQRGMAAELPALAEQVAWAVQAGLPIDRALTRALSLASSRTLSRAPSLRRGRGVLLDELARLERLRAEGLRLSAALRVLGDGAVPPPVGRYLVSLGVALERGSVVTEVAAAQAAAVLAAGREPGRRAWTVALSLVAVAAWSGAVALLAAG